MSEPRETWRDLLRNVPLWFYLALIAPIVAGIALSIWK